MDKNNTKGDKNNCQNPSNQLQPINDLSRFGHSVTLCKEKYYKIINYLS